LTISLSSKSKLDIVQKSNLLFVMAYSQSIRRAQAAKKLVNFVKQQR